MGYPLEGGFRESRFVLRYKPYLKDKARELRKNMTDSKRVLWSRLRGKQLLGVQFYRQKPIGEYIVDFYALKAKLVVEVDGSQHTEGKQVAKRETLFDWSLRHPRLGDWNEGITDI